MWVSCNVYCRSSSVIPHGCRSGPGVGCNVFIAHRFVQLVRFPHSRYFRRQAEQKVPAEFIISASGGCFFYLHHRTPLQMVCPRIFRCDRSSLVRYGSAYFRTCSSDLRPPIHDHAVRDRIFQPPAGKLHRRLAGRVSIRCNGDLHCGLVALCCSRNYGGDAPLAD